MGHVETRGTLAARLGQEEPLANRATGCFIRRAMRVLASRLFACSLVIATAPALAVWGCNGSGSGTGTPITSTVQRDTSPSFSTADETSLVSDNTGFAFALYQGLSTLGGGSTTGNLFYSPYSVSLALAMTYAGANGETATQMAKALGFSLPESSLNPAFDKLDLAIEAKPSGATGTDGAPFALTLADSLWGDEHVTFGQPFVNTLAQYYGASLRTVDFVGAPSQAEGDINTWVANETTNNIPQLLGPGAITSATELVIVNAVYFNAAWEAQFDPTDTQTKAFTRADGSTVQVPMMSSGQVATSYAKGSNYQAVDLPYSGNTTSMVIVLPNAGEYSAVEANLSGSFYTSVTSALTFSEGILMMPRFQIHGPSVSLVPQLKSLGMTDAFDASKADFTNMIPAGGAYITDVIHQAFVDVEEGGTVAAAATIIGIGGSAAPANPFVVTLNQPFFFFIRDLATNTVLFVGRENDPTSE
jgi:serpin B